MQDLVEIAADDLVAAPAVEGFGARVPESDRALEVAHDDGFGGEFQQFGTLAMMGLALAKRFGAFGDEALEVGIEALELQGFAVQLDEDADFGAQNFRDDGDGDVVDGAASVAVDLVGVGEVDAGDEDDGGFAESAGAGGSCRPARSRRVRAC